MDGGRCLGACGTVRHRETDSQRSAYNRYCTLLGAGIDIGTDPQQRALTWLGRGGGGLDFRRTCRRWYLCKHPTIHTVSDVLSVGDNRLPRENGLSQQMPCERRVPQQVRLWSLHRLWAVG
jgi:hypothetical protein